MNGIEINPQTISTASLVISIVLNNSCDPTNNPPKKDTVNIAKAVETVINKIK